MKAIFYQPQSAEKWDEFVRNNSSDFGLLQSSYWAKFQQSLGREVLMLAVEDGQQDILAVALIIKQPLKLGLNYFYLPRGPILADSHGDLYSQLSMVELLFNEINRLAIKHRAVFLRLDPAWQDNDSVRGLLSDLGCRRAGQVQPRQTLILDLTKSEDELLATMKSKTRYNIKLAQKHGVKISSGPQYFEDFWWLTQATSRRQEITPHSRQYYQKMLEALGDDASIIAATIDGRVVVANINIFFGDWCVYLHGASDYSYRDKMAPFLLQWRAIIEAQKSGKKYYDFWGVDEAKWPGVTRFKKGFAPANDFILYVGAWDKIYRPLWYNIYKLATRKR